MTKEEFFASEIKEAEWLSETGFYEAEAEVYGSTYSKDEEDE